MDRNIHNNMVKLSNNSPLTAHAAGALSKALETMLPEDKNTVLAWLEHAKREQNIKITNAEKKFKFR